MSHFKMFALVIFSLSTQAFAQNMAQVYSCYDSMAKAGMLVQASFDRGTRRPFYISQSSVDDKGFLVFRGQDIYRCEYPKEGPLAAVFTSTSCKKSEGKTQSYKLDLKLGMITASVGLDITKDGPKKAHISQDIIYASQKGNETFCEVKCKEELKPENTSKIEAEVTEEVKQAYAGWETYRNKNKKEGVDKCKSAFFAFTRGVQNALSAIQTTEEDCVKRSDTRAEKVSEARRKEVIDALKSCGGGSYASASDEIKKLQNKSPVLPSTQADADLYDDNSAHTVLPAPAKQ